MGASRGRAPARQSGCDLHREPKPEAKRLYIGNLRFDVNERELRELLAAQVGVESVEIVKDRRTHESRGFAFVDLISMSDATPAIETFDGTALRGRVVKVAVANPRGHRDGAGNAVSSKRQE